MDIFGNQLFIEEGVIAGAALPSNLLSVFAIVDQPFDLAEKVVNRREEGEFLFRKQVAIAGGTIDKDRHAVACHMGDPVG